MGDSEERKPSLPLPRETNLSPGGVANQTRVGKFEGLELAWRSFTSKARSPDSMSASVNRNLLLRIPLRQAPPFTSIPSLSIRHPTVQCIRRLNTHFPVVPPQQPSPFPIPVSRIQQRRSYASTIIHNQKYNDDNMPLTLEITPSCSRVPPPLSPRIIINTHN
jgi:hypothetical protein